MRSTECHSCCFYNNNKDNNIAPCGRNFRGAGDRSDPVFSESLSE